MVDMPPTKTIILPCHSRQELAFDMGLEFNSRASNQRKRRVGLSVSGKNMSNATTQVPFDFEQRVIDFNRLPVALICRNVGCFFGPVCFVILAFERLSSLRIFPLLGSQMVAIFLVITSAPIGVSARIGFYVSTIQAVSAPLAVRINTAFVAGVFRKGIKRLHLSAFGANLTGIYHAKHSY